MPNNDGCKSLWTFLEESQIKSYDFYKHKKSIGAQRLTVLQLQFSHWHWRMIKPLSHPTNLKTFIICALLTQKHIKKKTKDNNKKSPNLPCHWNWCHRKKDLRHVHIQASEKIRALVFNTAKNRNYPINAYFKNI